MKILLIGNETSNTDSLAASYAKKNNVKNYGLILDPFFNPIEDGYYHTSLADLSPGSIIQNLASKFDLIELLDQDIETYPHYKSFVTTLRMMYDLELLNYPVVFRNKKNSQDFIHWKELLKDNKSFCFYPYLSMVEKNNGELQLCPKNDFSIKKFKDIVNWQQDPDLNIIRDKMEAGIPMEGTICQICKIEEKLGKESARQFETLEWAMRISAKNYSDFRKNKNPIYYEVRPSNVCNIKCRTCTDGFSHLIAREYKTINFPLVDWKFDSIELDSINLDEVQSVYFGGGEPTIMPELYSFLRKCISHGKTNFDLNIGTNGIKISDTLMDLLNDFPNVCFAFSFDGFGPVNDYIRWGSKFDLQVENSRKLRNRGHKVSLQTVFSMYNLTKLHEIYEFYDREFSNSSLLINLAGYEEWQNFSSINHPLPELVLSSLKKCTKTETYFNNGRSSKSNVDSLIEYYSNTNYKCDVNLLKLFYDYNDKLDNSRGSKLSDYIPELAEARKLYNI
jgi:MoaA/NifB/PqqE/SkfB family radical SAM enzyme